MRRAAAPEKYFVCEGVAVGGRILVSIRFSLPLCWSDWLVHSFEPSPENFGRLQSATRKLPNVRLSQAAVGEPSQRSKIYVSDHLNVDHRAYLPEEIRAILYPSIS